jgi:hypothetical protein
VGAVLFWTDSVHGVRTAQSRALIEAIAVAPSEDVLGELRRVARREHGLDVCGSFLELLIELRQERLEQHRKHSTRIA